MQKKIMQTSNKVTPIRNQVLLKPLPGDNISEGGIIVPENFVESSSKCIVVAVGKGTKARPMLLCPGMMAHRVKNWGTELIIDGEKHYLMEDAAILASEN